jgi:diguanylate cyclase (GGDEF)-like protein
MRNGYSVLTAGSGQEALDTLSGQQRVDAVLLDVMMPGMSGIETLKRLRQSRAISELPVIMVTANDRSEDVVEALSVGANDYVTKPIDFPVALARIRTQVTTRRADPLTGLPNRIQFMDSVNRQVEHARTAPDKSFAVFFLDVDRFKIVNDSLGHMAGDELLAAVARRLEASLRVTDVMVRPQSGHAMARIGGDEFTFLINGIRDEAGARRIAERLLGAFAKPFEVQGREIYASASIGLVMYDPRYQRGEEMIRDADTAMYQAKVAGKGRYEVFDTSMLARVERRLQIEADLRHALEQRQFRVFYQPIVAPEGGELLGFEALLRWQHPERGVITPNEFIPIAEETGLIVPIGNWAMEEACRQMCTWDRDFVVNRSLGINVNLSARQCMQPDVVEHVAGVLERTGLAATRLKLEITEGVVLENSDAVVDILNKLRALGVQLGLDDFGMGYSALSYLQRFPFQTIKIDRSFVNGIHEGGNSEIIRAIVSLAGGLAMDVTAEGVETAEQVANLKELDCRCAQGYFFSKPLTADDAAHVLRSR